MTQQRNTGPTRKGHHLLEIEDLRVRFATPRGDVRAVNGLSLHLRRGETVAIVGESGSGKSVTGQAIVGILRSPPAVVEGAIRFHGRDVLGMSSSERREVRGRGIAMIFQDALAALNPVLTIGDQLQRLLRLRAGLGGRDAQRRAVELLEQVGIPAAASRLGAYPHEFSGGMRQRVMVAMAIGLGPDVLIADEPTTALDVTIQAQIMQLLHEIQQRTEMGMLLVTHDLGVVGDVADRVAVLYAGRVAEEAVTADLFLRPRHPYTEALIRSMPSAARRGQRLMPIRGAPPEPGRIPPGCPFHPRCDYVVERCAQEEPTPRTIDDASHRTACHLAEKVGTHVRA